MTKEQKQEKRLMMEFIVDEAILNPLEKIEHPKPAISFGVKSYESKDGEIIFPVPLGTYGNFSFVQAPPKSKKTFFVSKPPFLIQKLMFCIEPPPFRYKIKLVFECVKI